MKIPSIIDCYLTGRASKQELTKALKLDGHDRGFIAGVIEELDAVKERRKRN